MTTEASERYQTLHELGSGAMGRVVLALDQQTGEYVAIKRLNETIALQGGARMRREFRSLAKLSHPNVVQVLDYGEIGGLPYLVMEYVRGEDLSSWIAGKPVETIIKLFAQIADALSHVHDAGLIHRDLKPENIRVTPQGEAKLMDFGLSKALEESLQLTKEGSVVGTVLYMSPEQCRGGAIDARADLYAFGALLYWALTGRAPFLGESITQVLLAHLQQPPTPPSQFNPKIPAGIETLVLELLRKNPQERPKTAVEVHDRLLSALEDAPQEASSVARMSGLLLAPLIGRDAEMRTMLTALTANAGLSSVIGDAGSGKTRLLRALEERARSEGLFVSWAEAIAQDPTPFGTIVRLVDSLRVQQPQVLELLPSVDRAELSRVAPTLIENSEALNNLPGDPELARLRLFEACTRMFEIATRNGIVILENLHWADESTLALLAHSARTLPEARLIVSYRAEDLPDGLSAPRGLPKPQRSVMLGPLSDQASRELLAAWLGGTLEATLADELVARASGNPWLLEERLKTLLEAGAIRRRAGVFEWISDKRAEIDLPERLNDLLAHRLQRLSQGALEFARACAVLGREFEFEDARALLELSDDTALDALEELSRLRIVSERPGTRGEGFHFTHPFYIELLRDGLMRLRRRRLHARAAERLIGRAAPFDLAEHHFFAGNYAPALTLAVEAGDAAARAHAHPLAERAYRLGLDAANELGTDSSPLDVLRAHVGLARALAAGGRTDEAIELWTQAIEDAQVLPEATDLAERAKVELVRMQRRRGQFEQGLTLIGEPDPGSPRYAELCIELGELYREIGQKPRARELLIEALRAARTRHNTNVQARALSSIALLEEEQGQTQRGERLLRLALQLAASAEQAPLHLLLVGRLGANLYRQRRLDDALQVWEEALAMSRRMGDLSSEVPIENNIGLVYNDISDFKEALARFRAAFNLASRAGYDHFAIHTLFNIALCEYALGRLETARETFQHTQTIFGPQALLWITRIALDLGDEPIPELPALVPAMPPHLYRIVEVEHHLAQRNYKQVWQLTEESIQDYAWFWALARLHAGWQLGYPTATLLQTFESETDPGIDATLARSCVTFVHEVISASKSATERSEDFVSSPIGLFARDAQRSSP